MQSKISKGINYRSASIDNPSATQYEVEKFNTITNPMVTGGGPNNPLSLQKFENALKEKLSNPFKTNQKESRISPLQQTEKVGPGLYNPNYSEIGSQENLS